MTTSGDDLMGVDVASVTEDNLVQHVAGVADLQMCCRVVLKVGKDIDVDSGGVKTAVQKLGPITMADGDVELENTRSCKHVWGCVVRWSAVAWA